MKQTDQSVWGIPCVFAGRADSQCKSTLFAGILLPFLVSIVSLMGGGRALAQGNVLTSHNDIARTGQNVSETILTPANVNPTQFGKLFSQPVSGAIDAQPLYVSQLAIPGKGTHNVVFIATSADQIYAFDADTNGGANATPLWQTWLLNNSTPTGTLTLASGVFGTPVIDLPSQTMYLVSSEILAGAQIFRFHALDITTGAEKFGGPVQIQATVAGTGSGSVGGSLTFEPDVEFQRSGLLFLNGIVYAAFGSVSDQGAWHGWLFSYTVNASTQKLQQIDVLCTSPNATGAGIWMGGEGLVAEVYNPAKPYGRMFFSTGNGSFSAAPPYTRQMSYSMSVLDLDLAGGQFTIEDVFTPFNQALLGSEDGDLGSGGPILLPTQSLASGKTLNPLVELGKSGMIYILDRDNAADGSNNPATEYSPAGLGGFNASADQVIQEVQTPIAAGAHWGSGVWGTQAYWNNNIYSGGTNPGALNSLAAYSFVNGVLSTTPTSKAAELYTFANPTPSVSANGNTNGIVWILKTDPYPTLGQEILIAYDATNLANTLYSSNTNLARDNPGAPQNFNVPTIINGKVYAGAVSQVNVYGLLGTAQTAPSPTITPAGGQVAFPQSVTITSSLPGTTIYYTTNGALPNSKSAVYKNPIVVNANTTINAVASVTGYLQSAPASATFIQQGTPANPVLSLATGTYSGTQNLTITDASAGATIYYTDDGSTPTAASTLYTHPLAVAASELIQAVAIAPDTFASSVVSATYTIQPLNTIDFSQGFTVAQGPMQFNGSTDLDDYRLQLTNGQPNEAGSAFYATPVNIQGFTTSFTFQLSNPGGDGITFTIQNNSPGALGTHGGGLGYATIPKSVAIKFDIYSNSGEGPDSTGLYINGVVPTLPAINLTGTGIDLHSGDFFNATVTYNGTNLTLTLTDALTLATWSQSFTVNIPAIVGGNTAYVGFTGGTGGLTSSQKLTSWVYLAQAPLPQFPNGFNAATGLVLNGGATINGSRLKITDGGIYEARSAYFATQVNVQQFITSFDFQITVPSADGFTFIVQNTGPAALGTDGGSLGYTGIGQSVAVKFDFYNRTGTGDATGIYTNGVSPVSPIIDLNGTGINMHSGHIFNAQFAYNGTTLTVVITDTVTGASATQNYVIDIPTIVGGPTAWVGFTGATGEGAAVQDIVNWIYTPVFATAGSFPTGFKSAQALTLNGGAALNGTALQLTDGQKNEARSAFLTTSVNVEQFLTNFDFHLIDPSGDGFTFTIQGTGPTAVGKNGGSLGYGGIPQSLAIKFDLYSNAGEGADSTGLYTNGATPTVPSIDLSTTGINFHSGDVFNAQLAYAGTNLTVVITDKTTLASVTQSYSINIPAIVGATTAYVGFTGGSGGSTAKQDIRHWNYFASTAQ